MFNRTLTVQEILRWADAYREATGSWPTNRAGEIPGTSGDSWSRVDWALRHGARGLPASGSLAQFLAEQRGVRYAPAPGPLPFQQILDWADAYHRETGHWPTRESGAIPQSGGETWTSIHSALVQGRRGLPGGSSLAQFLAEHRGVRNIKRLADLMHEQILAWADAYFERHGKWPTVRSGSIDDAPGETWCAIGSALERGRRGLAGGGTLPLLMAEHRGVRNTWTRPNLNVEQILAWADAFHERKSKWPNLWSGAIPEAPGETWTAVDHALKKASRGLVTATSLARLLATERGVRNRVNTPRLKSSQILAWADAFHRRTGRWPEADSGPVDEAPGETWCALNLALMRGGRGLRAGSSLAKLLSARRGKRNRKDLPRLSRKKILAWADAHHARMGTWPNINTGDVLDAPGEIWRAIDDALRRGLRGLAGGSSLHQLLVKKRGVGMAASTF